ncbi:hypothetical protein, partial [Escherichia coli]|uniref:hypothetical protein n=1 Tax=Escherichia coli TaxID=562 RepID=UPI0030C675CD
MAQWPPQVLSVNRPSKIPVISKLELVSDIYPSLSLIFRHTHSLVFQGASSIITQTYLLFF